jgi:hypothetical protein
MARSADSVQIAESATLLPAQRDASILSVEGYGAVDSGLYGSGNSGGLSGEQRARIEEIGREVGS